MTVIAWDGETIAADMSAVTYGTIRKTPKLFLHNNASGAHEVLAISGALSSALLLADWYRNGADAAKFPECQKTENWARLIVASANGVFFYEKEPAKIAVHSIYDAWGTGSDFALASMYHGNDAVQAVKTASVFNQDCGVGITAYTLRPSNGLGTLLWFAVDTSRPNPPGKWFKPPF